MKRISTAIAAVLALVVAAVLGGPAVADPGASTDASTDAVATQYWFGDVALRSSYVNDDAFFTTFEIDNANADYPLPFHSYLTADLYDCDGGKAYSVYGDSQSVREPGRPWRLTASVSLNLPPRGGPYAAWVVTVHSKGHDPEKIRYTDGGPGFHLDCDGGYRRNRETFWEPQYDPKRPLNAAFGTPIPRLLGKIIGSFGRRSGAARVGATVNLKGARDSDGKPSCGLNLELTWSQHPDYGPHSLGTQCGRYGVRIDRLAFFRDYRQDGSYRTVTAPARGKRLTLSSNFFYRGHNYSREFDFGVIK